MTTIETIADAHHLPRDPRALGAALADLDQPRGYSVSAEERRADVVTWLAADLPGEVVEAVVAGYEDRARELDAELALLDCHGTVDPHEHDDRLGCCRLGLAYARRVRD